jgi:hypothetical protein
LRRGGYDKKNQSRDVEPADNRMLKADCHHRFNTFDTGLNPSSPVLLVTENSEHRSEADIFCAEPFAFFFC